MIRFIAAIDARRGIADDNDIPWKGRVPGDVQYYRQKLESGAVLMGYGTYVKLSRPYVSAAPVNYVATRAVEVLRPGFEVVSDAREFLKSNPGLIWDIGGAQLFASTLDLADELYLTKLQADFNCTKFFPAYESEFELTSESAPHTENGITYTFCIYRRK